MGLSLMLLMPRMDDKIIELEMEQERRKTSRKECCDHIRLQDSGKGVADAPLRWDEVCTLFTTWACC